jgi:hypothetical protein
MSKSNVPILPILPENIVVSIIKKATLRELLEYFSLKKLKKLKQKMIVSMLYNTHCAGCGRHNLVSLRGYVGEYCDKRCWRYFHDTEDSGYDTDDAHNLDYIWEKYEHILDENESFDTKSRAISKRHRSYYDQCSPSGKVWPMINRPCYNEIILKSSPN